MLSVRVFVNGNLSRGAGAARDGDEVARDGEPATTLQNGEVAMGFQNGEARTQEEGYWSHLHLGSSAK